LRRGKGKIENQVKVTVLNIIGCWQQLISRYLRRGKGREIEN
jgi:hypothetical protein